MSVFRWISVRVYYAETLLCCISEAYSEAGQTFKMKLFEKIVNGFYQLGCEYATVLQCLCNDQ